MIYTKNRIFVAGLLVLQACSTPLPSQMKAPQGVKINVVKWTAIDPWASGTAALSNDLRRDSRSVNVYWARFGKSAERYVLMELSPTPLSRKDRSEEIVVINTKLKRAHPAFDKRANESSVESFALCDKTEILATFPYSLCNSSFAGTKTSMVVARVLLGAMTLGQTELMRNGRVVLNYLSEPLENTLDGNAIDALVPAAAEQRRLAKMDVDRIAAEKQTAIREENARAFEQKRLADSAKVKSLSLLPRGYKDVCDFEPSGVAYVFYGDQTETYELVCVNSGSVPGLAKLKEAGFIVTNISERTSGSRASSRFNVEKIR